MTSERITYNRNFSSQHEADKRAEELRATGKYKVVKVTPWGVGNELCKAVWYKVRGWEDNEDN